MHIYGTKGYVYSDNPTTIRYKLGEREKEETEILPLRNAPYNNAFSFFSAVVRGDIIVPESDLSSLKVNVVVVNILEAAKKSNMTGKRVKL